MFAAEEGRLYLPWHQAAVLGQLWRALAVLTARKGAQPGQARSVFVERGA